MALAGELAVVSWGDAEFDLRTTKGITRETILAKNKTYLQTKWTFDFTAIYNPEATSYRLLPGGGIAQESGRFPTLTDVTLRHYLMQPRRKLVYKFGPDTILETPKAGYTTDAANGPFVEECSVIQTYGFRTFIVHLRIVALVNECDKNIPLLSHTWSKRCAYDQDNYATLTTTGEVVFRSDVLRFLGTYPDQYRRDFWHPVPDNCQRRIDYVEPDPDGVTITYQVTDTELPYNIGIDAPANRFEAFFTAGYSQLGSGEANLEYDVANRTGVFGAAGGISLNPMGVTSALVSIGTARGVAALTINARMIPMQRFNCLVKAWGNRSQNTRDMIYWSCAIALARLDIDQIYTNDVYITEQLNGRYCEVSVSQRIPFGDIAGGLSTAIQVPRGGGFAAVLNKFNGAGLGINNVFNSPFGPVRATVSQDSTRKNPTIPGGVRGTFLVRLVAQGLSEPCTLPPRVAQTLAGQRTTDLTLY